MNATLAQRPAKKSPPTERDLQIFKLAEIQRWTHDQIADHFGDISRRRVSQIVTEVRLWLAHHPADDPELKTELERKRLGRATERMHLENVITRALFALDHAPHTLQTSCHANGVCVANYHRDQPPVDVRVLKTYLRAVEALGKLNERPEIPESEPSAASETDDMIPWQDPRLVKIIDYWKTKVRNCAIWEDEVPQFARQLGQALIEMWTLEPPQPTADESTGDQAVSDPDRQAGQNSASHASPKEALEPRAADSTAADSSDCRTATCDDRSSSPDAPPAAGLPHKKIEKGSIAGLPLPVTQVQITPDIPGATLTAPHVRRRHRESRIKPRPETKPASSAAADVRKG